MGLPLGGCGCGTTTYVSPAQTPVQQYAAPAPMATHDHNTATAGGAGNGVRDPQQAQQWLDYIKAQVVPKFSDFDAAVAAGYKRNVASGNDPMQHYIHDRMFSISDPNNVTYPASLMYDFDKGGKPVLSGIMISAKPGMTLPDFGAGAWHTHPADDRVNMHVWFDKTVEGGAFENNSGMV